MEPYLTVALVLIALGVLMLLAEILLPTGGILVVAALLFFASGVAIILIYGTLTEAVVAIIGLAIGLPVMGMVAAAAWRKMSLDTVLDTPESVTGAVAVPSGELAALKGRTGKTLSPLRPSGIVDFEGRRVDAMAEGVMLDAGVWVRCVDVKWGQVIVRKLETDEQRELNLVLDTPPSHEPAPPSTTERPPHDKLPTDETRRPRDDFDDFDIGLEKR